MKRILLTGLTLLSLVAFSPADQLTTEMANTERSYQRYWDNETQIESNRDAREAFRLRHELDKEVAEARAAAREEAQRVAAEKAKAYWKAIADQNRLNDLKDQLFAAEHPLTQGDQLPLWNQYDDEATIRMYLRDSGYADLSDAQIAKVHAYMKANGIKHVSELGQ